jgi:hypothetical protein
MSVKRYMPFLAVLVVLLPCLSASAAFAGEAGTPAPGWEVTSTTYPTHLAPGGTGDIELNIYNIGALGSNGTVTVTDVLPPGIVATEAGDIQLTDSIVVNGLWNCSTGKVVVCTNDPAKLPSLPKIDDEYGANGTTLAETIDHIGIAVKVETGQAETLSNEVTVSGGGASAPAHTVAPITVDPTPVSTVGVQGVDSWASNPNGTVDTQAGSHPYDLTFSFDLDTRDKANAKELEPSGGEPRNVTLNLPRGYVGNPTAVPECTREAFEEEECPPATQVGIDVPELNNGASHFPYRVGLPVFNLVPPPGAPAEFAFTIFGVAEYIDASVRSGSDYGITAHADNITQRELSGNRVELWGEPSAPSHDADRYSVQQRFECKYGCASSAPRVPFLTLPTSCGAPLETTLTSEPWQNTELGEGSSLSHDASDTPMGLGGCDRLGFNPSISVAPDTSAADTPAGLTVEVKVPQEGLTEPNALAMSNIKDTTVVLPQGIVINPGQAAGLTACTRSQAALERLPGGGENDGPAACPNTSKVGTVQIATPLLKNKLEGSVYVMQSNPPDLELLITASGEGVNLKLVGNVHLNEATGQLSTTFSETPELPFTDFKLSFSGGAQAALDTPTHCGTYEATSDFTPWSTPAVEDAFPSSDLAIDTGPGGSGCPGSPLPFTPALIAGATTDQAGGYTGFSMLLQRGDDQQRIEKLQFKIPEGLSGMISKVPLCTTAQAAVDACPEASQIGHTTVESGPGPYPLVVPQPGQPPAPIYLTESYDGAPFGLLIKVPLVVGPFTLPTQVVRAKIEVEPRTAQITVTTDPLPQAVAGVPTDLRTVDAVIDREDFMFNPTNCNPATFSGTAWGASPPGAGEPGETAAISSHFQVGSCQSLKFAPDFKVSTSGKTSRADGASLGVKIVYPTTPLGDNQATSQANIQGVKVELPKQLPARLTTLQKACTAAQFDANPAGCPAASVVGTAVIHTPILPVPLIGPAYFVSNGGEAFPNLIMVVQGDGLKIELVGDTFISKAGITSSTFKSVPDQPFTSFELNLPEGRYSALATDGNLCKSKLVMPTDFTGQNGAEFKQNTKISVIGCGKAKQAAHKHKKQHSRKTKRTKKQGKRK